MRCFEVSDFDQWLKEGGEIMMSPGIICLSVATSQVCVSGITHSCTGDFLLCGFKLKSTSIFRQHKSYFIGPPVALYFVVYCNACLNA